jgi:cytochrome c oxidase cbb3-type subunit 3
MAGYGKELGGPLSDADIADMSRGCATAAPPTRRRRRPPARATRQGRRRALRQRPARSCHGDPATRDRRGQLGHPVFLALASDAFIRDAIVRGRPGTPMEAFGDKLTATADRRPGRAPAQLGHAATPPPAPPPIPPTPTGPVVLNAKGKAPTFTLREDRFVPSAQVKAALVAEAQDGDRRRPAAVGLAGAAHPGRDLDPALRHARRSPASPTTAPGCSPTAPARTTPRA